MIKCKVEGNRVGYDFENPGGETRRRRESESKACYHEV